MSKKSQEKYWSLGLCILCGQNTPRENRKTCISCTEKRNFYIKNKRKKRVDAGACSKCGKVEKFIVKQYCEKCYDLHKKSARKNYLVLRDNVFNAYGGYVCSCCGETERSFLTIDHINNDGYKHRKEIGQSNCYRWLRDNKYPEGFQVLCMNCQWGRKNCDGICPHQRIKNEQDN